MTTARRISTTELRKAFHLTDAIGRRIWTYKTLAAKAGVSGARAHQIINGKWRRASPSRSKVLKALGFKETAS